MKRGLFVLLSVSCLAAQASAWTVHFKKENGSVVNEEASVAEMMEDKRKLVFLAAPSPIADLKSASQLTDDAPPEVAIKQIKGRPYLLLTTSHGNIELTSTSGVVSKYDFDVEPAETALRLSSTCAAFKLRIKVSTKITSPYPAAITCLMNGKDVQEVVFSTMADAEWYGTGIFETAGKGERWKSFAPKDILALPKWDVTWGSGPQKNKVRLYTEAFSAAKTPPPQPEPPLKIWVGAQYLTGTVTQNGTASPVGGLQIPLGVIYQREKSKLIFGSGYDFFAFATSKEGNLANGLSGWNMWAGYQFGGNGFQATTALGYLNRSVDAAVLQTNSAFEAPRLSVDIGSLTPARAYGFAAAMAQTANQGQFSEMDLTLYYETTWGKRHLRYQVQSNSLKATALTPSTGTTTDFKTSWTTLGLLFRF